jgi:signal peptidase
MRKMMESKIFKGIMTTIKVLIGIVLVGFVIVVALQRFSNNQISFFNFRMFTVVSGSMKPKYDIGDVLISKEVDASTIKVGDAVSYLGAAGDFKNKVITHEVVKIEKDANGKYIFHTKGLANLVEDPVISESQIYGIVIYKSLLLSAIYRVVATNIGFYLIIILPLMYIVGSEVISAMLNKEEKRREKLKGSI